MSTDPNAQPSGHPPPAGPPPGAPPGQAAPPPADQASYPGYPPPAGTPGQQPYPYPPPGGYGAPPAQPGYYPAPGQYYPPPQPYAYPGYYPPPGPYPPPAGQYGQYPPPAGQYPPPAGQYPPPAGAPGTPGAPAVPGAPDTPGSYPPPASPAGAPPPAGQYVPPPAGQYPPPGAPPGQYPPPAGQYAPPPPPGQYPPYVAPYGMPTAVPSHLQPTIPGVNPIVPLGPGPPYAPPGQDPLFFLGTVIPDPRANPAPLGVQKVPGYDPTLDYLNLTHGLGNNNTPASETRLLRVILPLSVAQRDALNDYCTAKSGVTLAGKVKAATGIGADFKGALLGLCHGPLWYDVELLNVAMDGMGTNERLLTELIMGRPGYEIRWLKIAYAIKNKKDLANRVDSELSKVGISFGSKSEIQKVFAMALNTQKAVDSPHIDDYQVKQDVDALQKASKKKDAITFAEILINRSDTHIAAVIFNFNTTHRSLSKVVKQVFSGTMEMALLYLVEGAKPKRDRQGVWRDAKLLEQTMKGAGTKDVALTYRLIRAHWNPARMEAVKTAFAEYRRHKAKHFGPKKEWTLYDRVKSETSGNFEALLLTLIGAPQKVANQGKPPAQPVPQIA